MSAQLVGLSFAVAEGDAAYLPVLLTGVDAPAHLSLESVLAQLKPWLENPNAHKVMQHAKYDMHVLANQGIQLAGVVHDTMLQSYVLNSAQSHNLEALIHREIGVSCLSYEDVCGKGAKQIPFSQVDVALATRYAAEDADMTLRVHHRLWQRLAQDDKARAVYETMELPLQRVLFLMERTGVLIDENALRTQGNELSQTMQELEIKAFELVGHPFNLQSPKQVAQVLFDEMGIPPVKKTASGTPSTDENVLSQLADDYPLPKLLLEHRTCAKLKGTYTDGLLQMINPTTHRVHTRYAQAVVNTGRLSSQDPNLQNIPIKTSAGKRIREAFVAPDGWQIISADYSQIELRIMAHLSNDAGLMKAFINGEDVHRQTASEIFGTPLSEISSEQRRYAKTINFGLIYGMSAFGLSKSLGIARDAAKLYMDRYFQRYPNVLHYMENIRKTARNDGFVETICGRRLWISGLDSSNVMMRQGAERAAINAPMQGSAADLIKLAMIEVANWLHREKLESRLLMQVHDELVLEVPSHEIERIQQALPELMTNVMPLHVPLEVEVGVGSTWGKAH
jgi:DNA polymerase-1